MDAYNFYGGPLSGTVQPVPSEAGLVTYLEVPTIRTSPSQTLVQRYHGKIHAYARRPHEEHGQVYEYEER